MGAAAAAAAAAAAVASVGAGGLRRAGLRDHLRAARQRQAVLLRGDRPGHQVHPRVPGSGAAGGGLAGKGRPGAGPGPGPGRAALAELRPSPAAWRIPKEQLPKEMP